MHSGYAECLLQLFDLFSFFLDDALQTLYNLIVVLNFVDHELPIYLLLLVLTSYELNVLLRNTSDALFHQYF